MYLDLVLLALVVRYILFLDGLDPPVLTVLVGFLDSLVLLGLLVLPEYVLVLVESLVLSDCLDRLDLVVFPDLVSPL